MPPPRGQMYAGGHQTISITTVALDDPAMAFASEDAPDTAAEAPPVDEPVDPVYRLAKAVRQHIDTQARSLCVGRLLDTRMTLAMLADLPTNHDKLPYIVAWRRNKPGDREISLVVVVGDKTLYESWVALPAEEAMWVMQTLCTRFLPPGELGTTKDGNGTYTIDAAAVQAVRDHSAMGV